MAKIKNQDLLKFMDLLVKDMSERDQNDFCYALAKKVGVSEVDPKDVYTPLTKIEKDDFIVLVKMAMNSKYTRNVSEAFRRFTALFKEEYSVNN